MPETWKGKTRGGTFGYMFFIYMIRCLGITAAYGFLSLVVLYFIPFAPKATASTWQYARNRLKYGRAKAAGLLLKNYYRLGQILIDKVAIGNGMADKYHFEFENYQAFLNVLNGNTAQAGAGDLAALELKESLLRHVHAADQDDQGGDGAHQEGGDKHLEDAPHPLPGGVVRLVIA